jgi:hypothetical protein
MKITPCYTFFSGKKKVHTLSHFFLKQKKSAQVKQSRRLEYEISKAHFARSGFFFGGLDDKSCSREINKVFVLNLLSGRCQEEPVHFSFCRARLF